MGQSNALRFSPDGISAFRRRFPYGKTVNCAVGSTRIDAWQEGKPYFNACFAQMPKPTMVFFWQGENDTWDGTNWQSWGAQFTQICLAIKARVPHVQIIFAQLGPDNSGQNYSHWSDVQAQQAAISISNVRMIATKDLATEPADGIHMTPGSESIVGERVALAFGRDQ